MAVKKTATSKIDQKSPEYLNFVKQFNYRRSKDKKSFVLTSSGSSIPYEATEKPAHYEITLALFPDVSVSKFMEIAQEIYNKANSDIDTVKDFYDTSYAVYSFEIKFVDLYEIYLKHQ